MKTLFYSSINHFDNELKKYALVKKGASGTSTLFKLENKVILKFCPDLLPQIDLKAAEILTSIKVKSFAFPEAFIVIGDTIHGCIMDYVKGTDLNEMDLSKYPINDLIIGLQDLLEGIRQLSEKNIWCYDLCRYNIMCNGSEFTAIDTIEYQFTTSEKELAANYNIVNDLMGMLFSRYPLLRTFISREKSLKVYFEPNGDLKNYHYYFDRFLKDLQQRLTIYLGSSFKTIDSANKKYLIKLNK